MAFWNRTTCFVIIIMVIAQINLGLITIGYKYVADRDRDLRVIVAYRMILATILFIPGIFLVERYRKPENENPRPSLTWTVFGLSFLASFFGGAVSNNLTTLGLQLAPTTVAAGISKLYPPVTFMIAVIFRLEKLNLHTWSGRAKVIGSIIAILGAMIIGFYEGREVNIVPHYLRVPQVVNPKRYAPFQEIYSHAPKPNKLVGIVATLGGCISSAISILIQDKLLKKFPDPVRATGLSVALTALQCSVVTVIFDRKLSSWEFNGTLTWIVICYSACTASGFMLVLTSWCITKRGAVFVAAFSPITLLVATFIGPFILQDQPLHTGSIIGVATIIIGVYLILWGKKDENEEVQNNSSSSSATTTANIEDNVNL